MNRINLTIRLIFIFAMLFLFCNFAYGENSLRGKEIYLLRCSHCHGARGEGNGPSSHILNPKPTDFTKANYSRYKTGYLEHTISEGRGSMPSFKNILSGDEIKELVHIIRNLKRD